METSIKNTADCPVEDLLYLIQQDEVEQLRSALLDIIDKFQPNGEIYLYEQGYSLYEKNHKEFSPKLLASRSNKEEDNESDIIGIPSKENAFKSDSFRFAPTDDYIQVFSVESERSKRGLLITINKEMIDEGYINTLLRAYNHQIYLLRNKDTDSLTGLYNRQSFDYKLSKLHKDLSYTKKPSRSDDEKSNYYFALLDIDFFKKVNDEFGHVYGDEVLLMFSNLMKNTFRDIDLLFRYGGEEFAILLKNVTNEQTQIILNRFRKSVKAIPFPLANKVTVSIGYCAFTDSVPLSVIIQRADKALYYSKQHGRNAVNNFELLLEKNEVDDTSIEKSDIEIF